MLRLLLTALSLWLCLTGQAGAADPAPLLRIESGTHTAPIRALSVDAAGRLAVTAAEDKTARVWDLATGRLLQTLRPPVGEGNEGKLYAAAISPDGQLVATGGWSKENEVYLFHRSSFGASRASGFTPAPTVGAPRGKPGWTATTTASRTAPISPATASAW
jgi:WD40 repeat protein